MNEERWMVHYTTAEDPKNLGNLVLLLRREKPLRLHALTKREVKLSLCSKVPTEK
jgi:hypothetical protein